MSQSQVIIQSKINIPNLRAGVLLRQRVFDSLNQSLSNNNTPNVILISAPAGYGKTTLLASWLKTHSRNAAWLSLGAGDDSLPRFMRYLLASLKQAMPAIQVREQMFSDSENKVEQIENITSDLMRDLSNVREPIPLILEDYHLIESPVIHQLIESFVELLYPYLRLFIITRTDPPLPLAKWRVRGQLTEIRMDDLRFKKAEAVQFFKQAMNVEVSLSEIEALEAQTEGWVTGLQLVALSFRGNQNFREKVVKGNHRDISDYLMTEVINQLSPELKTFLLQTSILNRLHKSICNEVTNRTDSQSILEKLETENLFIISLDQNREWFRYHHLFADFLLNQLSSKFSENEIQSLHKNASKWFEKNGFISEAIDHALIAKDFDYAACLLGPQSEVWMRRGESSTILEKLKQLPDSVAENLVDLCIWYGWAYAIRGELTLAESWVSKAEELVAPNLHELIEANTNISIIIRNAYTQIFAIRALIARQHNDYPLAITLSEQALATVPEDNLDLRAIVLAGLSSAKIAAGDYSQADEITHSTQRMVSKVNYPYLTFTMLMNETVLGMLRGQLFKVHEASHEALQLCERESMSQLSFLPHIRLGRTYYLWNRLTEAEGHVYQGIENPKLPEYALSICNGTSNLALLQMAQGKHSQAFETLEKVKDIAKTYKIENGVARAQAIQTMIQLSAGDIESVTRWVRTSGWETFNIKNEKVNFPDDSFTVFCHYLIFYQKDWKRAQEALTWRVNYGVTKNRIGVLIDAYLLLVILHQTQNQNNLSMQNLYQALNIAEPENFLRPFIDYEKQMYPILNQIPATHEAFGFAQKVLSNFVKSQPQPSNLIEALNEQEMKILQLIAKGHTNPQIAGQLSLAVSTVRWYVKHIYRKLGVHNRTQATLEAQKQNLI